MQDLQVQTTSTSMDSSSSNTSSRRNSSENIHYPEQIGQHPKQDHQRKLRWSTHKTYSTGFGSVTEEPLEKDENEEQKKQVLPHLQMINDYQEFSQKISRTLAGGGRKYSSGKKEYRRRSCTPSDHALAKVEEEIIPEDDEFRNKHVFKFGLMLDKNEFNKKINRQRTLIVNRVEKKDNVFVDPIPILEDLREGDVKDLNKPVQSPYQISSPRYMLKVDEMDFQVEKKSWNHDTQEQEVIMEEKDEEELNTKGHQMFNKINTLLTEDRDYIKRIAKGEVTQDLEISKSHDQQLQQLIEEAVQCSSSDSDELPIHKTKSEQKIA